MCLNFGGASQLLIWLYFQIWVSMTSVDTEISCHTHRHIRSHVNGTSFLLLGVFWYTQFYTHKYIAGWLRLLHDNKAKDKKPILKFSNSSRTQVPWHSLSFLPSEIISVHDLLLVSEDHNSSIKESHQYDFISTPSLSCLSWNKADVLWKNVFIQLMLHICN